MSFCCAKGKYFMDDVSLNKNNSGDNSGDFETSDCKRVNRCIGPGGNGCEIFLPKGKHICKVCLRKINRIHCKNARYLPGYLRSPGRKPIT